MGSLGHAAGNADPGIRVDLLGDLVDVALGGQPGPDIQELRDARLGGQIAHSPAQELAVLHRYQLEFRRCLAYRQDCRPVHGEVVVATEPVVIHPRRRRDRGVDPERRRGPASHADSSISTRTGHGEAASLFRSLAA